MMLTWALYELAQYGRVVPAFCFCWSDLSHHRDAKSLARVRDEADRAFVANDGGKVVRKPRQDGRLHLPNRCRQPEQLPSADDLKTSLAFTECVLKETLRLHSVVPIVPRVTLQDDVLEGYFMPAGAFCRAHTS